MSAPHAVPQFSPASEAIVMGGSFAITLYGLLVIIASAVFDEELIPHTTGITVALLTAIMVVGGVIGAVLSSRSSRR